MMLLAKVISFLFNPLFILLPIPYILVWKISGDYVYALKWTLFSYIFTVVFAFFVFLGVVFRVFSNFDVSKREQRPLLFSFAAFAIFCYLLSLVILDGPKILVIGIVAVILGLIIIFFVNRQIKASIHVAVTSSFLLLLGIIYGKYYYLLLLLIPVLSWSRVKTKRHSRFETLIGAVLGMTLTFGVYIVTKYFLRDLVYNR